MPLKFRFALLTAALMLVLSVNALANSGEASPEAPAPAQEETAEKASPFTPLRTYAGEFADVKSGDWFAPSVVSAYEYGLLSGRGNGAFAPGDNVTLAEMLTIAARLRAIYTTGGEEVIPAAPLEESWYQPYVDYLKAENLLDNRFEGAYHLPASRAQMAGIFAFALPAEWYDEPNALLVTTAERSASRAEIAALLTRVVEPETRLTLTWTVAPYHSAAGATLAGLVAAPQKTALPASPKDTAAIDALVRGMLARGEHSITLQYPKALSAATANALTQAFTSCVKTYCEQMYNVVSCRSYATGRVVFTFSSTACAEKVLESYRAKTLAAAIRVHDSLWESGTLSYGMSQYEIAQAYYLWLCDNCRYDSAAGDDSASHLAYGALVGGLAVCDGYTGAYNLLLKLEGIDCTALFNDSHIWTLAELDGTTYHIDVTWGDQYGRTDLRYFGMSKEQSYQYHPWSTQNLPK